MKYTVLATAVGAALAVNAWAGPDKIKFPSNYLKGVLYQTVDRADVKQYRELYAPAEVVEAVRKGKPVPDGAVLTLVQWSVEQDANGVPLKGPDGRFIKKDVIGPAGAPTIPPTGRATATGNTPCSPRTASPTRRRTQTTRLASRATCRTPSRTT
jgi:hypothetical protein